MARYFRLLSLLWLFPSAAYAALITHETQELGVDRYRTAFTLVNDGTAAIEEFALIFELDRYSALAVSAAPTDWDPLVLPPDPQLPG